MTMKSRAVLKFLLLIVLVGLAVYVFKYSALAQQLTLDNIKSFVGAFGGWSFVIYILLYALGTLVSIPGTLLTFIGAILFGTLFGTLFTVIGATLGASAAFFASKYLGREFVQGLLKGKLDKLNKSIEKNAFTGILVMRLIPIFPFIGINYGCGLCNIRFRDYFTATFIGIIPGTFIYTYLFATLGERVLTGDFGMKDLLTGEVLLPIVLFILLLIVPQLYKKFNKKKKLL